MISAICPVCNTQKTIETSVVCENCGWIHVFFIQEMPEDVKIYLKEKQNIFENRSTTLQKIKIAFETTISVNEDLRNKLLELEVKNKSILLETELAEQTLNKLKGDETVNFDANAYEEKIEKVKLQIKHLEKHSREVSYQDNIAKGSLLCRLEGKKLIVIPPIGMRNFEIPPLAIGFSKKDKIILINEADVIIVTEKIAVDSVSQREFVIIIDLPPFDFKSYVVSLFQSSENIKISVTI